MLHLQVGRYEKLGGEQTLKDEGFEGRLLQLVLPHTFCESGRLERAPFLHPQCFFLTQQCNSAEQILQKNGALRSCTLLSVSVPEM